MDPPARELAVGQLQEGPRIRLELDPEQFPHEVPAQERVTFPLPERFVQLGKNMGPMLGSPVQAEALALDLQGRLEAWVLLETGQIVATRARLDWSEPGVADWDPWAIDEDEAPDKPKGPNGQGTGSVSPHRWPCPLPSGPDLGEQLVGAAGVGAQLHPDDVAVQ